MICCRLAGGAVLRVAAEEWVPHIAIVDLGGGNFTIRGPMANLLHALAQALNFSSILPLTPTQTVQRGVYKELADTRQQERAHFLASSALYKAAYQQVRKGSHALLVEDTTCRKVYSDDFTKYGRCDFYIGKEQYWPLIFSLIGRKGSPLIPVISEILEQMVAHDLYFKWLGDELPNATACLRASTRVTVNEPYSLKGLWFPPILKPSPAPPELLPDRGNAVWRLTDNMDWSTW
ncbi:hypothetical protein E2C01_024350 [Portunus trituberculatus]|uniref:Uncharacterized protein n=1 Tax=Portunus trituberculatus TaxID=210409 RepID=A0A5B7EAD0_PORTR|nr:hypothetical protein [Portunus trituberculatus]